MIDENKKQQQQMSEEIISNKKIHKKMFTMDKNEIIEPRILEHLQTKIKGKIYPLKHVLSHMELIQDMTDEEYQHFDQLIYDLGLTLVE